MLEDIRIALEELLVFRFSNPRDELAALSELSLSDQEVGEVLSILSRMPTARPALQCIEGSFIARNLGGLPFGPKPTRFSYGNWPVCYTALEHETAREEIVYYRKRAIWGGARAERTAYYHLVQISYHGRTLGLRPYVEKWPDLVHADDYSLCHKLAREAIAIGLHAFLTHSARLSDGTNVPVFFREALSSPIVLSIVAFAGGHSDGSIGIESMPQDALD